MPTYLPFDFTDAEFERLLPRKELPLPRKALPPKPPPTALPPAHTLRPPGPTSNMGIAGILAAIMAGLGGDVSEDARRFYEERDKAGQTGDYTRRGPDSIPPDVAPEPAPEPAVSYAGDGRYTFRSGKGAFNEPISTDRPEGMTYAPGRAGQATESLRARGGRYGGAAGFLNDLESAAASRSRTADALSKLDPRQRDTLALFDQFITKPAAEESAFMAPSLKALEDISAKEQQRREMEDIGKALGVPEVKSEAGVKRVKDIRGEQRAQAEAKLSQDREKRLRVHEENTQQWRMGQPPSPKLIEMRAEQILADEGYDTVRVGTNWQVMKKNTNRPTQDSEQLWTGATRRAQQQLMTERGQSASAVKHPAVVMGETVAKQNPKDPRVLNMPKSIAALKTSHPEMFFPDGKPMPAAVEEAAKQNFGR